MSLVSLNNKNMIILINLNYNFVDDGWVNNAVISVFSMR
ncbi:hypothetical protein PCIT_a1166 [Pseudoalteromonas citrea]|uniref:Uncharacterized protein n=1 Tax=Pseudoalteromonas citrea TaxID=43655 RepID=A0AAD4ALS9_9GAMM|nr:hypothetical protein PCIT_a1166 [Pseudoalteromonas citrea]